MHVHQHIFIAMCRVKHLTHGNKDILIVNDQNSDRNYLFVNLHEILNIFIRIILSLD